MTEAGLHRLTDGKLVSVAAAGSGDAREMANLLATTADPRSRRPGHGRRHRTGWKTACRRWSRSTAGRQMAGSGWIGLRTNDKYRVQAVSDTPLFATLLSLAVLLLAFGGMWYREGR